MGLLMLSTGQKVLEHSSSIASCAGWSIASDCGIDEGICFYEEYTHTHKLSKTYKFRLLAESTFQQLQVAFLMTQFSAGHEKILVPGVSSQEAESLKDLYVLLDIKASSLKRESYRMRHYLDQMSFFSEKVNTYGSHVTLVG